MVPSKCIFLLIRTLYTTGKALEKNWERNAECAQNGMEELRIPNRLHYITLEQQQSISNKKLSFDDKKSRIHML